MGKQTNAQILRFLKNKDWFSKYYSSYFNYSNLIVQDILIREYIINFISLFNTKVAQVYIYREKYNIIIRVFSYNDSFTNWNAFLSKHQKKINSRNYSVDQLSLKHQNILDPKDLNSHDWFKADKNLTSNIFFFKNAKKLDYISLGNYLKINQRTGYSGKRLLSLNLSYLLKTNVIIKNTNIISNNQRFLLLKIFNYMGLRLRSPLSKYLRTKFICLVYYSLLYKSSLLLCRYLRFIIPRFCKKKRKSRKINPFLKSLKFVIGLMFTKKFSKYAQVKGVKIICKGRINGSRRKRIYVIKRGQTSTQSFKNEISYYQEDCLTIFGILGIKVWIIY
jgi:hypothetical protein